MDSAIVLRKCKSKAIRNAKISYLHPLMYLFLSQKNNELSEMVFITTFRTDARGHKSKHFVSMQIARGQNGRRNEKFVVRGIA